MTPSFAVRPGLCESCRWIRVVTSRNSMFVLCRLSETDARFPRYPALPVLQCQGYSKSADVTDVTEVTEELKPEEGKPEERKPEERKRGG